MIRVGVAEENALVRFHVGNSLVGGAVFGPACSLWASEEVVRVVEHVVEVPRASAACRAELTFACLLFLSPARR